MPNDDNGKCIPFVIVGDEAFALSEYVLRPYPNGHLTVQQRIHKYGITRARRMVEYTFGILSIKRRTFHSPLNVTPQFCYSVIKACCILHNFVRRNDGFQLENTLYESSFESVQATGIRGDTRRKHVRDHFTEYFTSPHGFVPWQ